MSSPRSPRSSLLAFVLVTTASCSYRPATSVPDALAPNTSSIRLPSEGSASSDRLLPPTIHGGSPFAAPVRAPMLPNLRSLREPASVWRVSGQVLTARVSPSTLPGDSNWAHVRLHVDLDAAKPMRVRSVSSPTQDTSVVASDRLASEVGSANQALVEVRIPRVCPASSNRESVTLVVSYQIDGEADLHSERLDIDHRCLLGDIVPRIEAASYAQLASRYAFDPVIDDLTARASSLPTDSVAEEVEHVLDWLHFDPGSVQRDPLDAAAGWRIGTAYALSPSETARLGGDCEDWAILLGAYLARRGWTTSVAHTIGHVWVRVEDRSMPTHVIDVDILGGASGESPSSETLVRPLRLDAEPSPMRRTAALQPDRFDRRALR